MDYNNDLVQNTDFQLPLLSFTPSYSDMPNNVPGSNSEFGGIDEEIGSQVNVIIKPILQNPKEKPESKQIDEVLSRDDARGTGTSSPGKD